MFDVQNIRGNGDLATDLIRRHEAFVNERRDALDGINYAAIGRWVLVTSQWDSIKGRIGIVTRVDVFASGEFYYMVDIMQWRYPSKPDFPRDQEGFYRRLRNKSGVHYPFQRLKFLKAPRATIDVDFRRVR